MCPKAPRSQRLRRSVIVGALARGLTAILPLLTVPIALTVLGVSGYAAWAAATSLSLVLAFSDLGVGSSVMTRLAVLPEADSDLRQKVQARELIAASVWVTSSAALSVIVMVWVVIGLLYESGASQQMLLIGAVTLCGVALNIPAGLINKIQYGLQDATYSNVWQGVASLSLLGAMVAALEMRLSPVAAVAIFSLAVPTTNALNALTYFALRKPHLRPQLWAPGQEAFRSLVRLGSRYLAVSVLAASLYAFDPLIVVGRLGPSDGVEYVLGWRITVGLVGYLMLLNLPSWPASAEALRSGERDWVRATTRRFVLLNLAMVLVWSILLIAWRVPIFEFWIGTKATPPSAALLGWLALQTLLLAVLAPLFMVQNAGSVLMPQFIGYTIAALVTLPIKFLLAPSFGAVGLAATGALAILCFVVPAAVIGFRQTLDPRRAALVSN